MIDWSVYPDWYSDVIHEAAERGCPEALIINEELQRLAAERSEILLIIDGLNSAIVHYRKALEEIRKSAEYPDSPMEHQIYEIAQRVLDDE